MAASVVAIDCVHAFAEQIGANLRCLLKVNRYYIAQAAIETLAKEGKIEKMGQRTIVSCSSIPGSIAY